MLDSRQKPRRQERKGAVVIKRLEAMAAAMGMAQEGGREFALEILAELDAALPSGRKKILAVAKDEPFSRESVAYTLGLAERMDHDVVFLDIVSRKIPRKKAGARALSFRNLLGKSAGSENAGRTHGSAHAYQVLTGEFLHLVRLACRRMHGVALVICQNTGGAHLAHAHIPVPVFSMERALTGKHTRA